MDPLLILAFEIVGGSFMLGWLVGGIVTAEVVKGAERKAYEAAFMDAHLAPAEPVKSLKHHSISTAENVNTRAA